jgi:hypothetical protein
MIIKGYLKHRYSYIMKYNENILGLIQIRDISKMTRFNENISF